MVLQNWPNDSQLNYMPIAALKDYIKIECILAEENYDSIEKAEFF
jgi:hypothetical protein